MRLILVTDSAEIQDRERDIITAFLEGKGWSVWHWFKDLWLIDGVPDDLLFGPLRDEILDVLPLKRRVMILSTEGAMRHSGWVLNSSIPWLKEHWQPK